MRGRTVVVAVALVAVMAVARAEEDVLEAVEEEEDGGDDDVGSLGDFIDGISASVLAGAAANSTGAPEGLRENALAFYHAVDWRERWIQGILVAHAATWAVFFAFRRSVEVQTGLFFGVCACVAAAERLNALGRAHWQTFATQNYFDERGVFAATVFCGPLLALAFCMLLNFVSLAAALLVDVKRRELKKHRADRADADAADGARADRPAAPPPDKPIKAD